MTDMRGDHIHYLNPESKTRESVPQKADKKTFLKGWKKRIIVLHPEND